MQDIGYEDFVKSFSIYDNRKPTNGQFELTYRCNLDCIHCYCKGSENRPGELSVSEIKNILGQLRNEGCLWLCLTGGEPLIRDDFLEIYIYAKNLGFLVSIFTNGQLINDKIIGYLTRYPPFSIEITLNGITKKTYEDVTQAPGSFEKIMEVIPRLVKKGLPLILKTNGLKQNKDEILKIKAYTESLLGKGNFKFDSFIHPRLNGSKEPCEYRLSAERILDVELSDGDMIKQRDKELCRLPQIKRDKEFIYQCNSWLTGFFINPYGRVKFCYLSDDFSADLRTTSFKEWFYGLTPQLTLEKFKTDSFCKSCDLRTLCFFCPSRAFLETGDRESSVDYYCQLAKMMEQRIINKNFNNEATKI